MRIVYYTRPCYFDEGLSYAHALSMTNDVHLVLDLSPSDWTSSLFDVPPVALPAGITEADPVLRPCFPSSVAQYWENAASFRLAVYSHPKSVHPVTWRDSRKIARYLRSLDPDILHIDDPSLRLGWSMSRLKGIRTVLNVHDPEAHSGEEDWRYELACKLVFPRVRRFILHSSTLRSAFQRRYHIPADRVHVVRLGAYGIFTKWTEEPVPEEANRILFFGRLSRYKGLEVLFAAAPRVAEAIPNVRFTIAGASVPGYRLPEAPALPNGGTIEIMNRYIRNAELARLFQQAAVVVCPYEDATQSGVVLTAYAFGKPVVATATGGLPEYVEEGTTGMLVPVRDVPALSGALIRMLADDTLRRDMQDQVRSRLDTRFSWRRVVEDNMEVYRSVLQ